MEWQLNPAFPALFYIYFTLNILTQYKLNFTNWVDGLLVCLIILLLIKRIADKKHRPLCYSSHAILYLGFFQCHNKTRGVPGLFTLRGLCSTGTKNS